jgi:hypothetical protein
VLTEYKTLDAKVTNPTAAVRRNVLSASGQVPPDGEVVVDGRPVGLTEQDAKAGYQAALRQNADKVAATVYVILGDGRIVAFRKEIG